MYFSIKKYFKNHRYTKHVINNCVAKLKRVTWIEASLSSNKASWNIEFVPQNVRWRPLKWPAYSCHFYSLMRSEEFNNVISWKEFKTWVQCTLSFPNQWLLDFTKLWCSTRVSWAQEFSQADCTFLVDRPRRCVSSTPTQTGRKGVHTPWNYISHDMESTSFSKPA
jgi:hypothetical protein